MNREEKAIFIRLLKERYRKSSREKKGEILGDITDKLSVSRKHAIRLMCSKGVGRPRNTVKRGATGKYQFPEFKQALRQVWVITDYLCSKSLKEAIPDWLPYIEDDTGKLKPEIHSKLLQISPATIDRILHPYKVLKGKSLTRSGGFREDIPIQENIWDITIPGFIETDTVAHCGSSMGGEFINTLTVVDIATLWTDADAVYGRGSSATFESLKTIESELPFEVKGYDADNGGEVLNQTILSYFTTERLEQSRKIVQVTRSRAYKKNDNAHVEQRNDSIARHYLGYERLEFTELRDLISFYYRNIVCPLKNHFIPCFKLCDKIRIKSQTRRVYKKPATPYSRIMNSECVSADYKERLATWHQSLNPIKLRRLEKKVRKQIDATNKKLKSGQQLSAYDLRLPEDAVV